MITFRRSSLDRALAGGADPLVSRALARRAAELTTARRRQRLANSVHSIVSPRPRGRMPTSAIQPPRQEVDAARPLLLSVEEILRSGGPVYAQGMARLRRLLGDGGSPLYYPSRSGELREELENVIDALEGRLETSHHG